ncbi:MAG: NADase-type glycan-binding domain-containing protein [Flammeovirgaceae bacterium]
MKQLNLIYSLFFLLLVACSSEKPTNEADKSNATTAEQKNADRDILYLEGLYATSTRSPQADFGAAKLFDGDESTYWVSNKGAGPDEGIMMYFKEKTFVESIKITQAQGVGIDEITSVLVYANGKQLPKAFEVDEPIKVGKALKVLFIRIKDLSNVKAIESESETATKRIEVFNANLAAAISELKIYTTGNKLLAIQPPVSIPGSIEASSTLKPQFSYHPNLLFDARKEFVWVEGNENAGEGEQLSFRLDEEIKISALEIWNGYQRSKKHFSGNARVKSFEFGLEGGAMHTYTLKDEQAAQLIQLQAPVKGTNFIFKVKEVYPGGKYKDLAISEMRFYNGKVPMVIANEQSEKESERLLAQNKDNVLGRVLNKRFKSWESEEIFTSDRSIILRSDYTFVIYQSDSDEESESSKELIADGGWELIAAHNNKAKVRIFGKLLNLSESQDFYKGKTTGKYLQIFQDVLHITNDAIKGEKFFGAFKLSLPDSAFVDVSKLSNDFVFDLKYATSDNFIGEPIYECGRCLMRFEAAMALLKANELFTAQGYRIKFFDCYRPLHAQKVMWNKFPNPSYVANPYKGIGSIHNRGGAVDITLVDESGKELNMGTPFDFFGKEAHQDNFDLPQEVLANRKILREGMEASDFRHIRTEWWHYSYKNKTKFQVSDTPFRCS